MQIGGGLVLVGERLELQDHTVDCVGCGMQQEPEDVVAGAEQILCIRHTYVYKFV